MSMINFKDTDQSLELIKEFYSSCEDKYEKHTRKAPNGSKVFAIAFGVFSLSMLTIATIAHIVEPIFKGFLNIIGSPLFERLSFKEGLKQLFEVPYKIYDRIISTPRELHTLFTDT